MNSNFAIAYSNEDGKDFNGIPWILDDKRKRNIEDIFTWEYVRKNKI